MTEKVSSTGVIKNPLTVIAIFAGLAEVSATIALPQLPEKIQTVFVWFVMLFPAFLVGLFFAMLWFKHRVLYAPSDFKNEENFMSFWVPSKRKMDAQDEEDEPYAEGEEPVGHVQPESTSVPSSDAVAETPESHGSTKLPAQRSRYLDIRLAEDLAIKKLTQEMKLNFLRDVALHDAPNVSFDAIAEGQAGPVMVEVVRVYSASRIVDVTRRALTKVLASASGMPFELKRGAEFILAIVVDELPSDDVSERLRRMIMESSNSMKIETRLMKFDDLKKE